MNKWRLFTIKITSVCFALLISLYSSATALMLYYFVHESGHIIFGFISNLGQGKIVSFKITSWVSVPVFPFSYLELPQQTTITSGQSSVFFAYGGIIFGMFVILLIFLLISRKLDRKRKYIAALIPIIFIFIFELIGDFLCGTDNSIGRPLVNCNSILSTLVGSTVYLLTIPIFFLIYDRIEKIVIKMITDYEHYLTTTFSGKKRL